jgi:hypothetical protein
VDPLVTVLSLVAMSGWAVAGVLYDRLRRTKAPVERPGRIVMLDYAGRPESVRAVRMAVPESVTRPRGRGPAMPYKRLGLAVVFQATEPS